MRTAVIFLTYNRPNIGAMSISSALKNTDIKPVETVIIDDCSEKQWKSSLFMFAQDNGITFLSHGRNMGIGYTFEKAYNLIRQYEDIDVVAIIETDYLWRKGWMEDCLAVFEASPHTIAIAGCNHPDMYLREKTHGTFVDLMKDQFGHDLQAREHLYKPFTLKTTRGDIQVQGVSNSCGCQIMHWGRIRQMFYDFPKLEGEYWKWMDRAFHKNGTGNRRYASDAHMSGTLSMFAEYWMRWKHDITVSENTSHFGFLDICDHSISTHICGMGINGMIVAEGETFVGSPKWNDEFLEKDPRTPQN